MPHAKKKKKTKDGILASQSFSPNPELSLREDEPNHPESISRFEKSTSTD